MSAAKPHVPYRLAFRVEGDFVNVYFAPPTTMDGALLIASMRRSLLSEDPVLWEDWKTSIRLAFDRQNRREGVTGTTWSELRAPENERTGNA